MLERETINLCEWLRALCDGQVMQTRREASINGEHDWRESPVDRVGRTKRRMRRTIICRRARNAEASPRFRVTADGDADDASQSGAGESRRLAATHVGSLAVIRLRAAHTRLALLGLF